MSRRNLLNLALLLLLAVLVTLALYEPGIEPPPQPSPVSDLTPEQISLITIQRTQQPPITLQKKADGWWLTEPALPAREGLVQAILQLAGETSQTHYPLAGLDLAALGLEDPRLCIQLNQQSFCFGSRTPLEQLRYLQHGEQVHLITDTLSHRLTNQPSDYVSLRLLPETSRISAIQLPELFLQQSDQGWQLQPSHEELSGDAPQQLVDAWQQARALTVAPYQPQPAEEQINIVLENGETITFDLLHSEPELVLARPALGIQYHLSEGSLQRLTRLSDSASE